MAKVEALSNIRFHSSQENLCLPNGKCSDCGNWCIYIILRMWVRIMKNKCMKKNIFARQNYRQTFKKYGYEPISGEKMKVRKTK